MNSNTGTYCIQRLHTRTHARTHTCREWYSREPFMNSDIPLAFVRFTPRENVPNLRFYVPMNVAHLVRHKRQKQMTLMWHLFLVVLQSRVLCHLFSIIFFWPWIIKNKFLCHSLNLIVTNSVHGLELKWRWSKVGKLEKIACQLVCKCGIGVNTLGHGHHTSLSASVRWMCACVCEFAQKCEAEAIRASVWINTNGSSIVW